jgi:tetratricopeptide (TPR) repeat protein
MGDYDKAMALFERDLEITEELGDKQGIAIALGLIGELLSTRGDFHRAIEYLQKNLMLCEELGYQKGIAKAVNTLGDVFFFTEQYDRSLHFYNRAIEVTRKIDNKAVLCISLIEKGLVLIKMHQLEKLPNIEQEALQLARELGNPNLLFQARTLQIRSLYLHGYTGKALSVVTDMLMETGDREEEAELNYLRYRILPVDTAARDRARYLFQELYKETPRFVYQKRLEALHD